jgi:hypothetical protein
MPDLTEEEKKVILFLLVVAVCGTAVNMLAKSNCRLQKVLCRQEGLSRLNLNKVSLEEMVASRWRFTQDRQKYRGLPAQPRRFRQP